MTRMRLIAFIGIILLMGLVIFLRGPGESQVGRGKFPVALRGVPGQQNTLKVDTSTTPNRTEIGCEVDQEGGTTVNGIRIIGAVSGSAPTIQAIGCTNGGDASPGLTLGATGTTTTILGSALLSGSTITATATSNQIVLGAAPNTTTITAPAPTGAITLTLPRSTDTLVGRSTTDVMTNKTISGPSFTATQFLASVGAGPTPLTLAGDIFLVENTQVRTILPPGVPGVTLRVRPGSNPGTCKLVAVAGTSTEEKVVLDNIGSGC